MSSLLQTAVSVLQGSYLDSTSQGSFQYSQAVLVENAVFLSEVRPVGEQSGAGISLGAADTCICRFIGRSVFPLQHVADLPALRSPGWLQFLTERGLFFAF